MKRFKKHKGAALVSVMIAITFISIVATTLLLVSLNNYQMKVVNSQSKENFYETEQRLNVVTTQIRDRICNSTNVTGDVRTLLGGVTTAADYTTDSYTGAKIAELAFPNPDASTTISGSTVSVCINPTETDPAKKLYDNYYFYGGSYDVVARNGNNKEINIKNLKVKQVNASGYENTIKTDLNFFVQIPAGGSSGGGGIGSCSFILDSSLELCSGNSNPDKSTRINVYGNTIFGKYTLVNSTGSSYTTSFKDGVQLTTPTAVSPYSTPIFLGDKTYSGTTVTKVGTSGTNKSKAVIYLREFSSLNFLSDTNVILGDIYLQDQALLNVVDGSFTCYGDIFVADKAAFVCNGTLNLGVNSNIYSVDSYGNCTLITATTANKNVIVGTINHLDKLNYDKICDHLKLFDDEANNDGVLPNILVKATPLAKSESIAYQSLKKSWNGSGYSDVVENHPTSEISNNTVAPMYCYDLADAFNGYSAYLCEFDGIKYRVAVPEGDLNGNYENQLILVNNHTNGGNSRITQNIPNSTIISKNPVYCYDTHGVCVSRMGEQAFNYMIDDANKATCRMNLKSYSGSNMKQFCIADFFSDNANSYVMTVFTLSAGDDTTSGPQKPSATAASYSSWVKDVN